MSIIANELIKIYSKKAVLFIFAVLILMNAALLYINEFGSIIDYTPSDYKKLYSDISGLSNEDALAKLEREYRELSFFMEMTFMNSPAGTDESGLEERFSDLDVPGLIEKYKNGNYIKYTDSLWTELALYKQVTEEVKAVCNYGAYLQKIDDDAEKMTSISIFAKPDTFAYRNIKKTPMDFAHLKDNHLQAGVSKGVAMAAHFFVTDIIAVFLIITVCIILVTREKEQDCLRLVKTTYRGRFALIGSKLTAAVISCVIIELILYATNFFMAYHTYGFGDTSRYIQSVSGYIGSSLEISVVQYFIIFLSAKLLVYILITTVVMAVCIAVGSSMGVYMANAALFGISSILYFTIPSSSVFSVIKYINIIAFMETYKIFSNYRNLNLFGMPVNYIPCFLVSAVFIVSLLAAITMVLFCRQKDKKSSSRLAEYIKQKAGSLRVLNTNRTVNVFAHEFYKIMITNKVLLILIVFASFQLYSYKPEAESFRSMDEVHYKRYMLQLEGEINEDKEQFLSDEQKRFDDIMQEIQKQMSSGSDNNIFRISKLSEALAPQNAFNSVLSRYEYLKSLNGQYKSKGWFIYDSGYQLLTAYQSNAKDLQLALLSVIIAVSCFSSIFACEFQTGMIDIISPTRHGRRRSFYSKLLISVFISVIIFAMVYIPEFVNIFNAYGTKAVHAPVYSMPHLSNVKLDISILQYLVLISLFRFIGLTASMFIVFALSVRLKSMITSALASTAALVLPLLLSLLRIDLFDYILLTPVLSGNILFKNYSLALLQHNRLVYIILTLLFTNVILFIAYTVTKAGQCGHVHPVCIKLPYFGMLRKKQSIYQSK